MAKKDFLARQEEMKQAYFDAGEELGTQKTWDAVQNRPVVVEKKDVIPEGYKACIRCGKLFKPNKFCNGKQIYCDITCQRAAQRERYKRKEYYKNYIKMKREDQRRADDGLDD